MIKAILCDIGGVLHSRVNALFRRDAALKYNWDLAEVESAWSATRGAYLVGKVTEDEFWTSFLDLLTTTDAYELLIPELKKKYRLFCAPNGKVFTILDKVKEHQALKFVVASNKGKEMAEYVMEHLQLKDYFDEFIFSHELQVIKPHKEFFEQTLKKLGLKADECVFIDDQQRNIDAAGMEGILFTTAEELEKKLIEMNLMEE